MEIMDSNEKGEEIVSEESIITRVNDNKCCADCKTTKTPLWRSGPAGPKSLCNACGIRYRKKRVGTKQDLKKEKEKMTTRDDDREEETSKKKKRRKVSDQELRRRVMALGKKVALMQRPRSPLKRRRRKSNHNWKKLGEVEQAAVLLMALSCGSILA